MTTPDSTRPAAEPATEHATEPATDLDHVAGPELSTTALAGPHAAAAAADPGADAATRPSRKLWLAVSGFVLVFGLIGYVWRGSHAGFKVAPGESGAVATAPDPAQLAELAKFEALLSQLEERMKAQPDNAEGWTMLGRAYSALERHADALAAFKRSMALRPGDAQALVDVADGMANVNQRSLAGEPEKLVQQALVIAPTNPKALAMAGSIAYSRDDFKAAVGHWALALTGAEPGSAFADQLQQGLAEARQRAGLLVSADATVAAATQATAVSAANAAGGGTALSAGAGSGPAVAASAVAASLAVVTGRVSLSAALKAQAAPDDLVFIFARAPVGSRMPLAILRKRVRDLPVDFVLDDSLAMSPAARLSGAQQVVVGARISKSGQAMPQPGDLQGLSATVAVGSRDLRIEINEPVP